MSEPITITYHTIKDSIPREESATYVQHDKGSVSGLLLNSKHSTDVFVDNLMYWQKAMVTHNIDLASYIVDTIEGTVGLPDGSTIPADYPVFTTSDEDFTSFNVPEMNLVDGASVISFNDYQQALDTLNAQAAQDLADAELVAQRSSDLAWAADVKVALALDVLSEEEMIARFGSDYAERLQSIDG